MNGRSPIFWPWRRFCAWVLSDMLSCPPAATMSASPSMMCCAPSATARRPEPQTWLMPQAALSIGRPALICACRAGFWPCAAVSTWPRMVSETSALSMPARATISSSTRGAEIMRGGGGEGAAERADGGACGRGDDDIGHEFWSPDKPGVEQLAPRPVVGKPRARSPALQRNCCRRPAFAATNVAAGRANPPRGRRLRGPATTDSASARRRHSPACSRCRCRPARRHRRRSRRIRPR